MAKSGKNFFENGPLLWLKIRKKSPAFESWGFLFWENLWLNRHQNFFQNFMYPKGYQATNLKSLYLLALSRGHTSKINFLHIKSPLGGAGSRALPCNKKIPIKIKFDVKEPAYTLIKINSWACSEEQVFLLANLC